MRQAPINRWLVLTEFGVELQPTGRLPTAQIFAREVGPYRRKCSVVNEQAYKRAYGFSPKEDKAEE